jgi:hypothetical protein
MAIARNNNSQKPQRGLIQDTLETIRDVPSSIAKNAAQDMKGFGTNFFDQLMGNYEQPDPQKRQYEQFQKQAEQKKKEQLRPALKPESFINIFDQRKQEELRTIRQLTETIQKELVALRQADQALQSDIADIEKVVLNSGNEKPGIYHIRFLEMVLEVIKNLRAKIGESRTWMQAMTSKKAKRGSAFAARSKKSGTSYSMSEELKITRNTQ